MLHFFYVDHFFKVFIEIISVLRFGFSVVNFSVVSSVVSEHEFFMCKLSSPTRD